MDIKKLYALNKKLRIVKVWYLVALTLFFTGLAVYGLRQNNFTMIRLREAVVQADKQNGDTEKALRELRQHVHGHMNTDLASGGVAIRPPVQLKARYERLTNAEQARVDALNQQVRAEGEAACAARFPAGGFNSPRVSCIQDYVSDNAHKPKSIPGELYKFDFVSPRWSPDLAGFSLLAAGLFLVLTVLRLTLGWFMKQQLD